MANIITKSSADEANKLIKKYVETFYMSDARRKMLEGNSYYNTENTKIMERKMLMYAEDENGAPVELENPYKSNNKMPASYVKLLVDQKVNYSLGKPVAVKTNSGSSQTLTELFGKKFRSSLKAVSSDASKKGIGWAQVYVSDNGEFRFQMIPAEEVIPVPSMEDPTVNEMVLRVYKVTTFNKNGDIVKVRRVEVWDSKEVTYYQEDPDTHNYTLLDEPGVVNPRQHYFKDIKYGDKVGSREGKSFGKVPFIELRNNSIEHSDLQPIKSYVDVMDFVQSDFANNLEDFTDIYWVLKGYEGENLAEFMRKVQLYKSLKVPEDGDAHTENVDVPHEARMAEIDNLEDKIFLFGMGVNTNKVGDGNITNVVIKSRFANLDLKANEFEEQLESFLEEIIEIANIYYAESGGTAIEYKDIVFNRSLIINEKEMLEANAGQMGGAVSETTRLTNHPWVEDAKKEQKAIQEEMGTLAKMEKTEAMAEEE